MFGNSTTEQDQPADRRATRRFGGAAHRLASPAGVRVLLAATLAVGTSTAALVAFAHTASGTPAASAATVTLPPAAGVFDYQIGGPYTPVKEVRIVDRDHDEDGVDGKYNFCYVNTFQTQPGALDTWPTAAVLKGSDGKPVEDPEWKGEYLLDTRTDASRAAIMSVVGSWIDQCASKQHRFQAVEADNLDSYTRDPSGQLSLDGNKELARLLVVRAHADGLAIGQKNSPDIASTAKKQLGFDFAITESCQYFGECDRYTNVYGNQVYEIEYTTKGGHQNFEAACAARKGTMSITYRDYEVVPKGDPAYVFEYC